MTNFYLRFANYLFLQSVEPVIWVKYLLHDYFWSGAALYVLLWLNTVAGIQMLFIECNFIFFMTLFLKKIGIILSAGKYHSHSRHSEPILKILSIYQKGILEKQLFQAICSKYVFRLLHAPKFQILSAKLNMMLIAVKLFTGLLWKSCSDELFWKTPMHECLLLTIFTPAG